MYTYTCMTPMGLGGRSVASQWPLFGVGLSLWPSAAVAPRPKKLVRWVAESRWLVEAKWATLVVSICLNADFQIFDDFI